MEINLLEGREEELERFFESLSDDAIEKLKKANIKGIKDFITKDLDNGLIEEHKLMKELIKKEFRKRQNKKPKK